MKFFINIKHLSILTTTDEDELIKKLASEFHFFTSSSDHYPQFEIKLIKESPPKLPELVAKKILPHALIYYGQGKRYIDYQGKALIIEEGKLFSIYANDSEFLFELAFLTIHSLLGDLLQELGLYRIHALAGTYNKKDFIIMLPSGGGKSTMLATLLEDPEFQIISDDSPLIDSEGRIHPFPTKISLSEIPHEGKLKNLPWNNFTRALHPPKFVLSLSHLKNQINETPQDPRPLIILGQRSTYLTPRVMKMNRLRAIKSLLENMVIGIGLPQIIEIFLKFKFIPDFYKMTYAFLKRSGAAYHLFQRSEHYEMILSQDIKANCQQIKDLIDETYS
ncbi:MAG: hypothetical protein WDA09_01660 [Bacteriovoracaceae bacterium]